MSTHEPPDPGKTYYRIRPTEDSLEAADVQTGFRQLHGLGGADANHSLWAKLLGGDDPPTVECLLLSAGESTHVEYYFGIRDGESSQFKSVLRSMFPDSFEIQESVLDQDLVHATVNATADVGAERDPTVAAVEFHGSPDRRKDWQTRLKPFDPSEGEKNLPLSAVVETMASEPTPMAYQCLIQRKSDWTGARDRRQQDLETNSGSLLGGLLDPPAASSSREAASEADGDPSLAPGQRRRINEIESRETRNCFILTVRLVAVGSAEETAATRRAAEDAASALDPIGHTSYQIDGCVLDDEGGFTSTNNGKKVLKYLRRRALAPSDSDRPETRLPTVEPKSLGIVADPSEIGNFCLLGGDSLTKSGTRALEVIPGERTSPGRPSDAQLAGVQTGGLALGRPRTQDGVVSEDVVSVPPSLQRRHQAVVGRTGSGKSGLLTTGFLTNHEATNGLDVLIDPKGGDMITEYLRSHYSRFGTLENVYCFDVETTIPALSFFDISDALEAGVERTTAIENKADHYVDVLSQLVGEETFDQSIRSRLIIKYVVKSLYDVGDNEEGFSHHELQAAIDRMKKERTAPPASDPQLRSLLEGVVTNDDQRMFERTIGAVKNRIEHISGNRRLRQVFAQPSTPEDPTFDLGSLLDEDAVVIFDLGDLKPDTGEALTLVILSELWMALKRRTSEAAGTEHPLVNVCLEEAPAVAVSDLLGDLLSRAREFDASLTLSMQFPRQLKAADADAHWEVLNNAGTIVTGNVAIEDRLAERLATDEMVEQAVKHRLGALAPGEWLVSLPAEFGGIPARPFVVESLPLPPGHPAGDRPLSEAERTAFMQAAERMRERTRENHAYSVAEAGAEETTRREESHGHLVSTLPYSERFPDDVEYVEDRHALACTDCGNQYDPDAQGMKRTIRCCGSLEAVDRADVPICRASVKLTRQERAATGLSDRQLQFLQSLYNAQQGRYDAELEYDIVTDSMVRLREYTGIDRAAVEELVDHDAGLLTHHGDQPHRLYSVTAAGRDLLNASYRRGIDHGHRQGDLNESSQHVFAVEVGRRYVDAEYVTSQDSAAVEAVSYYDLEDGRLDFAGLDETGEIVVAGEAECINNDAKTAVPNDYDKLSACDPEEAVWIVMNNRGGRAVLEALCDPFDDEPRIEEADLYSANTRPRQYTIDKSGFTEARSVKYARKQARTGTERS